MHLSFDARIMFIAAVSWELWSLQFDPDFFLTNFWIVIDLFKFSGIGCRISLYNEYQSRRVFGKLSTLFLIAIFGGLEL